MGILVRVCCLGAQKILWGPGIGNSGTRTGRCPGKHQSPNPIRLLSGIIKSYRKQEYFFCLKENCCCCCCCYYNYMVCFGLELGCEKCGGKKVEEAFLILSFKWHFLDSLFSFLLHRENNSQAPAFSAYFL